MKKQMKTTVACLMAAAISLTSAVSVPTYGLFGITAHASVISGEGQDETFTGKWAYNSDTKTLTLSGKMYIKDVENTPWKQYEADIQTIIFSSELEIAGNQINTIVYFCHTAKHLGGSHPDGFSWDYEVASQKLTLSGTGVCRWSTPIPTGHPGPSSNTTAGRKKSLYRTALPVFRILRWCVILSGWEKMSS